jgi:hypothetical protein
MSTRVELNYILLNPNLIILCCIDIKFTNRKKLSALILGPELEYDVPEVVVSGSNPPIRARHRPAFMDS